MTIPILIQQLEVNESLLSIQEADFIPGTTADYDIIRYDNPDDKSSIKVNLEIRPEDIIAYFIVSVEKDTDFIINLFTSIGNFFTPYTIEIEKQLKEIIHG